MYGVIEYNSEGKPKCEICGKCFSRVLNHVRQKHNLDEKSYKKQFGFDLKKGICSKESAEKSRLKVMENYDNVVVKNLHNNGKKTRFLVGSKGITKDKVSEQTRIRLKNRLKEPFMQNVLKKIGSILGFSGKGNESRWAKKE